MKGGNAMSVAPMKAVSIIGLQKYFDKVINVLGDSQSFDPDYVTNFYSSTENFVNFSEPNPYAYTVTQNFSKLITAFSMSRTDTDGTPAESESA